jgi:hypothetical protein
MLNYLLVNFCQPLITKMLTNNANVDYLMQ